MEKHEELQVLFRKSFGYTLAEMPPPLVLERLRRGPQSIVCVLFWGDKLPQHQLVLQELTAEERVIFYNPYRQPGTPQIGETLSDPPRRVEGGGKESVTFDVFRTFFTERHAVCYSTEKP